MNPRGLKHIEILSGKARHHARCWLRIMNSLPTVRGRNATKFHPPYLCVILIQRPF